MTQKCKRFLALILAVLALNGTAISASASDVATIASLYLNSYSVGVVAVGDDIHVDFTVSAVGTQDEVGVYMIAVRQQQDDGSWLLIDTFYGSDYTNMIAYNTYFHAGTFVYEAEPDHSYYFILTVFAGGEDGSDAKNITSPIVSN